MKIVRNALMAVALAFGLGMVVPASAADSSNLPNLGSPQARADAAKAATKQDEACTRCHNENEVPSALVLYQTKHGVRGDARAPGCTSCHGASEKHIKGDAGSSKRAAPDVVFKKGEYSQSDDRTRAAQCQSCHEGGKRAHWEGAQHQNAGVACNDCHKVHQRTDPMTSKTAQPEVCFSCHKTERAQTHRISTHPLAAGKMACSDCHNPHGSVGPKLLAQKTVNETCYTCHAEKRGPFLWEHGPVVDDCTNCHTPHGSTNAPLLKTRAPFLCQECHSGDHGKSLYSGGNLPSGNVISVNGAQGVANQSPPAQLNGRACMNCHSLVHGSNHPAGAKFQR